ncbi:hypothetical protein BH09MYX1_BH09MYX1_16370 [soil metagenome]
MNVSRFRPWHLAAASFFLVASCKRDVDMVLPDSGAASSASAPVVATATATATGTADPIEPLATLSSGRVAPYPVQAPPKPTDGGVAPTGTLPPGVPTGTAGLPTALPTATATATTPAAGAQPAECEAAKLMRQLGRINEAATLRTKCVEKGGKDPFG